MSMSISMNISMSIELALITNTYRAVGWSRYLGLGAGHAKAYESRG
jgi:hypothetical protein